jgi:hypothetical protein
MGRWSKRGWLLVCCVMVAVLGTGTALAAGLHWSIQSGTSGGLHNARPVHQLIKGDGWASGALERQEVGDPADSKRRRSDS